MKKWVEVSLIMGSGALGGLVSVIDAWQDPLSFPLTFAKFASLFIIPAVKGGVAAGIGVYLLTTVDSAQLIRTCFFAVTCGLAFPSVISNASSYASRVTSQVASQQVAKGVAQLQGAAVASADAGSPESGLAAAEQVQSAAKSIELALPKVPEADVAATDSAAQGAVTGLAANPIALTDTKAVDAIAAIAATSNGTVGLPLTRQATVNALISLRDDAKATEAVKRRASSVLQGVEGWKETPREYRGESQSFDRQR